MNVKPAPFNRITIVRRPPAPIPREGRTKFRMACKRLNSTSSAKKSGYHSLREAMRLITAWRKNDNVTPDVVIEYHQDGQVYRLETEADWAFVILLTA